MVVSDCKGGNVNDLLIFTGGVYGKVGLVELFVEVNLLIGEHLVDFFFGDGAGEIFACLLGEEGLFLGETGDLTGGTSTEGILLGS